MKPSLRPRRTRPRPIWGDVPLLLGAALVLVPTLALGSAGIAGAAEWEREARTVEAVPTSEGFSFRSTRDSGQGHDEVIGTFDRSMDRFQVGLVSHDPPTQLLVNLTFHTLYEYRDVDASGGYDVGDEVVGRTRLRDVPRSTVLIDLRPDLQGGYLASVTYPIAAAPASPAPPGTFMVRFHIVDKAHTTGGIERVPSAVLMELWIEDYPFRENETALALETRADASLAFHAVSEALQASVKPFEAVIGWETSAVQGDHDAPVNVAVVQVPQRVATPGSADQTSLLFSYPRSSDATSHSTVAGFRRPAASGLPEVLDRFEAGDWRIYVAGLAVTLTLVGFSLYRRIRA